MTPEQLQALVAKTAIHWDIQPAGTVGFVLLRSEPGAILPEVVGKYPSIAAARAAAEARMRLETATQMERFR